MYVGNISTLNYRVNECQTLKVESTLVNIVKFSFFTYTS